MARGAIFDRSRHMAKRHGTRPESPLAIAMERGRG
jgi:hypothetical protein